MKHLLIFSLGYLMVGCSLFDTNAGRAQYTVEPIVYEAGNGKQAAACCRLTVYNSKNVESVNAWGSYDPETGKIEFKLGQAGVSASEPIKVTMEQHQKAIEAVSGDIRGAATDIVNIKRQVSGQ
jgi:hypothetical protein